MPSHPTPQFSPTPRPTLTPNPRKHTQHSTPTLTSWVGVRSGRPGWCRSLLGSSGSGSSSGGSSRRCRGPSDLLLGGGSTAGSAAFLCLPLQLLLLILLRSQLLLLLLQRHHQLLLLRHHHRLAQLLPPTHGELLLHQALRRQLLRCELHAGVGEDAHRDTTAAERGSNQGGQGRMRRCAVGRLTITSVEGEAWYLQLQPANGRDSSSAGQSVT